VQGRVQTKAHASWYIHTSQCCSKHAEKIGSRICIYMAQSQG